MSKRQKGTTAAAAAAAIFVAAAAGPASAQRFSITDLGTLGGNQSFALGISEAGQITGTARTTSSARPQIAFLGDGGGPLTNLGTLPGSTFSRAFTVNNAGVAVGEAFTSPATGEGSRAVLWRNGVIKDIFSASSVANDINEAGVIAGQRTTTGGTRAFAFTDANGNDAADAGETIDIGTLRADQSGTSFGFAINNAGRVVGRASTDAGTSHAFVWSAQSGLTDLGSLSGASTFSEALGISDAGRIVGRFSLATTGQSAFVWENGVMTDLGRLPSLNFARAIDLNDAGQIVGTASPFEGFSGRAVLWESNVLSDLNEQIAPGTGWTLTSAEGINAQGQVVGFGTLNGQTRAFLLTPNAIPEPATGALLAASPLLALALARSRSRRGSPA